MTEIFNKNEHKEKRRVLRGNLPPAEVMLWMRLRGRQVAGLKFRRQYGVGVYVLDFYCPARHLALEIDGPGHAEANTAAYDRQRQAYIESLGIHFLRFTNEEIYGDLDAVVERIATTAQQLACRTENHPQPLLRKEGRS